MNNEHVFFAWKSKTSDLITKETTIPLTGDNTTTPLEYFINAVIHELEEEDKKENE